MVKEKGVKEWEGGERKMGMEVYGVERAKKEGRY